MVSIGSTPTSRFATDLTGISEIRPGVYMFYDLFMAGLGVCQTQDIALSVLSSVIGYQKQKGWIIIDAGWMALSRDRSTAAQSKDQRYGLVCDAKGAIYPDLVVTETNQEHGIISLGAHKQIDFEKFPIGGLVRILPNHACATAAKHDRYHVIDQDGDADACVTDIWYRIHGW